MAGELRKQLTSVWIFFFNRMIVPIIVLASALTFLLFFHLFLFLAVVCGEAEARVSGRAPMQGSIRQKPISHRANFINMEYSPTFSSA